ncbi:WXG100 family type VII secretion target [Nocardia mangyaensis]|uniref:WXG100 family type VII secretion target n=1 Tax=Nocardia mangyaensis TaxID=2213200 RepID=UPI002675ADC9|nr:WXG100 family type VII secretion target [Nocardia mangyaensis]MDO3650906.1 WXG100 family type VII secretion target [Nocardia mangyaensis]
MDDSRDFTFDTDELDRLIGRANGFIGFLTESLDGVNSRMASIQQNWQGAAADAQDQAYREWATGAATVIEGLTQMYNAAVTARDAYSAAAEANLRMSGG